ncbi:MAG: uracil-DNA glycosylase [Chitinophagaceae bacterium]
MEVQIEASWKIVLAKEFEKPYFKKIVAFLKQEKQAGEIIYPKGSNIFHAFEKSPFSNVKVVILGQDPYHGIGQAHGLSFSVPQGIESPPSLINIFKELKEDLQIPIPTHGNLETWALQGILLLNATLTVKAHQASSHTHIGWQIFTDKVIQTLSEEKKHLVFILWGNYAKQKTSLIDPTKHLILTAAHPSPLSAYNGFFGCKHFSTTNKYLSQHNISPIAWDI